MDDLDHAQKLELASRDAAIAAQRNKQSYTSFSHCIDCGEAIPHARQAIKGISRCLNCQIYFEKKAKTYGR